MDDYVEQNSSIHALLGFGYNDCSRGSGKDGENLIK